MVLLDDGLVLYIPFSEGAPDVVTVAKVLDRSQAQNNGTINGAIIVKPYEDMSTDSEDEGDNPLVIYDDDETIWANADEGIGAIATTISEETTIVKKGSSSTKILVGAGAKATSGITYTFAANQDWSQYDYITFWWYGVSSGDICRLRLPSPNWGNFWVYTFIDNFSGWQRFIIPMERFAIGAGAPDWSDIDLINFIIEIPTLTSRYLDRTTVDVGNWKFGEAGDFDGINDEIDCGSNVSVNLSDALSISFWIYPRDLSNSSYAYNAVSYYIWLGNTGVIQSGLHLIISGVTNLNTDSGTLIENVWNHVVITYDKYSGANNWKIYVNGKIVKMGTETEALDMTQFISAKITVAGVGNCVDGYIDEFRIYNRAITTAEVNILFKQVSKR